MFEKCYNKLSIINLPNAWQEGSGQLLLSNLVPVQILEPSVVFDVVGAVLQATIALSHVSNEQMLHKRLGVSRNISLDTTYLSNSRGNFIFPLRIFW